MANELLVEGSTVLYQSRYCDQQNFDLIISALRVDKKKDVRTVYKVKYPKFVNIEPLDSTSAFSTSDKTLTSGSNIWTTCSYGANPFLASNYHDMVNSVQLTDRRQY